MSSRTPPSGRAREDVHDDPSRFGGGLRRKSGPARTVLPDVPHRFHRPCRGRRGQSPCPRATTLRTTGFRRQSPTTITYRRCAGAGNLRHSGRLRGARPYGSCGCNTRWPIRTIRPSSRSQALIRLRPPRRPASCWSFNFGLALRAYVGRIPRAPSAQTRCSDSVRSSFDEEPWRRTPACTLLFNPLTRRTHPRTASEWRGNAPTSERVADE